MRPRRSPAMLRDRVGERRPGRFRSEATRDTRAGERAPGPGLACPPANRPRQPALTEIIPELVRRRVARLGSVFISSRELNQAKFTLGDRWGLATKACLTGLQKNTQTMGLP